MKPGPERALPVYTVDDPECVLADQMVAAVTAPLPTTPVSTTPPKPIPTELQRLPSGALAPAPTPPPKTGIMDMETLLQRLLPETPREGKGKGKGGGGQRSTQQFDGRHSGDTQGRERKRKGGGGDSGRHNSFMGGIQVW